MILHFLHILRNRQIHRPKQPVLPCILTGAEVLHFLKIYSYYSIINRGNQLLFATFLSQIANSFVCTKPTVFPEGFLVISNNLIFSDGFHPGKLHFSAGFFPNPAVAYQRQTYRSCAICCTIVPSGDRCIRCGCNRPPPLLHFAIFRAASFIIFATKPKRNGAKPHLLHIRGDSAGNPSVLQSHPGETAPDPPHPC